MGELLAGKTVIVTGAGGGIGLATALHLLDEGAQVVATVHSEASLPALKVDDDNLVARVVDVTDEQQVKDLIAFTVKTFGKLDGIVNNAGVLIPGTILDASVEDYQKTFDVNVKGVFLGSKYAIPELLTAYTASKGAVLTLTKAIALDFGARGIRANTLCPGFVDTPLNVPHYTALGGREELEAGLPDFQPIGRAILPIEIAHSVAFLLSDHSTAITGTAFVVDGGVLAGA